MEIRPVGAKLFHEDSQSDGRTDMMKLIVSFRYFTNASKNPLYLPTCKYIHGNVHIRQHYT